VEWWFPLNHLNLGVTLVDDVIGSVGGHRRCGRWDIYNHNPDLWGIGDIQQPY